MQKPIGENQQDVWLESSSHTNSCCRACCVPATERPGSSLYDKSPTMRGFVSSTKGAGE